MAQIVLLDSGVVGLICASLTKPNASACLSWVKRIGRNGSLIVLSEVTYFEVKRGLVWKDGKNKLARFDQVVYELTVVPVNRAAWDKAAEFWALLYKQGKPTADPKSLDGDAVLAGVAISIIGPGDTSIIATTNKRHLNRFPGVDAQLWTDIE